MFLATLLGLLLGFCLGTLTEQRLARRPARLATYIVAPATYRSAPPAHDPDSPPDTLRSAPDNEPPTVATGVRS